MVMSACAEDPKRVTRSSVSATRDLERAELDFGGDVGTAERFGLDRARAAAGDPHGGARGKSGGDDVASSAMAASTLRWTTPPGWNELTPTSMRAANFRPGASAEAECYLTLLAGDAGGLAANVNRWRGQLGLAAERADVLAALPRVPFLGAQGQLVEFSGTWRGMDGKASRTEWSLLGVLLVDPRGSAFLKMTGPRAVIEQERANFLALAESFHDGEAPPGASANDGMAYELPTGWTRAPDRQSRAFGFYVDDEHDDVQCYVTRLGGDAGGALANVNRWRNQIGLEAIDGDELARAPAVRFAGRDAILIEADGPKASLLGALACGPAGSVFVKLVGPPERVHRQRSAFLSFCESSKD